MSKKGLLISATVIAMAIVSGSMAYLVFSARNPGTVNGLRIVTAAKKYTASLQAQGLPIPASVSLEELISRKLLTESDVSGFAGITVTVNLATNESEARPQDVLIRARLPDGHDIVALADGSVQQISNTR
jgi:hypothetical protein